MPPPPAPLRVFISYAPEDAAHLTALERALSNLVRQAWLEPSTDRSYMAGDAWEPLLEARLQTADLVLLLISPDFMASDVIHKGELATALERHDRGDVRVVPVFVRPMDLKGSRIAAFQGLPRDGRPITRWEDRDDAWLAVVEGLRELLSAPHPVNAAGPPHRNGSAAPLSGNDPRPAAGPGNQSPAPSKPAYANDAQRRSGEALFEARTRLEHLLAGDADPDQIRRLRQEIDRLKRELRRGPEPTPGQLIDDRYRVLSKLGRGGFSTVWKALDLHSGRAVALKVLRFDALSNELSLQRFKRGAKAMLALSHPHILRVLEPWREEEDAPGAPLRWQYVVLEIAEAGDLQRYISTGPAPPGEVVRIVIEIAKALEHAHAHGCIHRDVKPGNILLMEDRTAKLTDFDLARLQDSTLATKTGTLGTPFYAAPELLRHLEQDDEALETADRHAIDGRMDVYSLAMTLLVALNGRQLSTGEHRQLDRAIGVLAAPEGLKQVVRRGIEVAPEDRYPTMAAFREALEQALEAELQEVHAQLAALKSKEAYEEALARLERARANYPGSADWERERRALEAAGEMARQYELGLEALSAGHSKIALSNLGPVLREDPAYKEAVRHFYAALTGADPAQLRDRLSALEVELGDRDQRLGTLQTTMQDREDRIRQLAALVGTLEQEIRQRHEKLAQLSEELRKSEARRNQDVALQSQALTREQARCEAAEAETKQLRRRLDELSGMLDEAGAQLATLLETERQKREQLEHSLRAGAEQERTLTSALAEAADKQAALEEAVKRAGDAPERPRYRLAELGLLLYPVTLVVAWLQWAPEPAAVESPPIASVAPALEGPSTPGTARSDAVPATAIPIDWVSLPGGTFMMGDDKSAQKDERPAHKVTVSPFEMSKTEVTVAQYRACVTAKACQPPDKGEYCNYDKSDREDHPINCVLWEDAQAFVKWVGGGARLPTEAEWEYAARGTGVSLGEERKYSWGSSPEPTCEYAVMSGCQGSTFPVCSKTRGDTPEGICDMTGNVWEWTADCYDADYYSKSRGAVDPAGPQCSSGSDRVLRGGAWSYAPVYLRSAFRYDRRPGSRNGYFGFRVVLSAARGGAR